MSLVLREGKYFGDSIRVIQNDFFQCNISKYAPRQIIQKHYHENNYLSLLINGKYIEKNTSGDFQLEAGNVIFRPFDYDHANNFQNCGGLCLNIELKQNHKSEFDLILPDKTAIYQTGTISSVYKLLLYFMQNADDDLCMEQVMHCFIDLSQQLSIPSSLPWINKVKKILDEELEIHHTLQSVSERVFVHPVYLASAFKKKTGFTIGEYQLNVKLKKSLSFLFNTSLPIHEIAFRTGFYDAAHFVNSFKLVYRISPQRFRSALKT